MEDSYEQTKGNGYCAGFQYQGTIFKKMYLKHNGTDIEKYINNNCG